MAILGLMSTEAVGSYRWTNIRRRVFYEYPNGKAPLIGILSMMKEESTNDPVFSWWEKRLAEQVSITLAHTTANVPFAKTIALTAGVPTTFTEATQDLQVTANTLIGVRVTDSTMFRIGHVIQFRALMTSGSYETVKGLIVGINRTLHYLAFRPLETTTSTLVYNSATNIGMQVQIIGSSFAQGVTNQTQEVYHVPIMETNYTQIFRSPMSFTGPSLLTPVKFDDTGIYKDKAKETAITHMIEMEKAFIFGTKYMGVATSSTATTTSNLLNSTTPDATTGIGLPQYTTGGILYWLQCWESANAGTTGNGYDNSAVTLDTEDNKRIIANSGGGISLDTYEGYLERMFRTTSNASSEKLCLCGNGHLRVLNQMWRQNSSYVYNPPVGDTFGMEITACKTPFGTVYYKTHPLFNQNATLRNNGLYLDIGNLRYRPFDKRDTQLLKDRGPRDMDGRMDEWFTDAGLEVRFPESMMYIQNLTSYTP